MKLFIAPEFKARYLQIIIQALPVNCGNCIIDSSDSNDEHRTQKELQRSTKTKRTTETL